MATIAEDIRPTQGTGRTNNTGRISQVIGAVGVAGAGGAANDESCAMQAIRAKFPGAARAE